MLELFFAPGSSSMAPHIALNEVGAAFVPRPLSFRARENRTPAYLALNPEGKVPTLVVDGQPLTEVAAILCYLARTHPEAGLLPRTPLAEAQALSWMSFAAATLHPARARGTAHALETYALADRRLATGPWALGETYSIADIHLFRLFWRLRNSLHPPAESLPALEAHYHRMMDRPAVIKTIAAEAAIGYELPA